MKLYAETSAILRWLLGAPGGEDVGRTLSESEGVVASRLTLAEARRVLTRALALGEIDAARVPEMHSTLLGAAARWVMAEVSAEILDRTAQRFPAEPVRSLDAIHLVTAQALRSDIPDLHVLSTDERIRRNAILMGIPVVP